MAVTRTNLIMGPATLYTGVFGATEPADGDVDNAVENTSASASWTNLGGTNGGVTLALNQEYTPLSVDQLTIRPDSRRTSIESTITTSLAEPTLENLLLALNDGTSASGSGYESFEPTEDNSATQPTYRAYIMDGYAPGGFRRRVIVRRALSTANVEMMASKENQTLLPVSWLAHYVSSSIKAYKIVDQTS